MLLVFNAGSSSLKFQLFRLEGGEPRRLLRGAVRDLGAQASLDWEFAGRRSSAGLKLASHSDAAEHLFGLLAQTRWRGRSLCEQVSLLGHRIVHGGESFRHPVLIDEQVLGRLAGLNRLAPLHNPPALEVIALCRRRLRQADGSGPPMVAVFDTAYFHVLPEYARAYALPARWQRIRRCGFHGLAHRYLVEQCVMLGGLDPRSSRVISLQLGHGCSIAAVRNGRPVDTSMGYTPLEGLVMATRPGDLDAGILLELAGHQGVPVDELERALNTEAGLLGLSGVSADMRRLLELARQGHAGAGFAIQVFCHRARKYLGACLAVLGGADAIVFGGGTGAHSPQIRERICAGMQWCGLELDLEANREPARTAGLLSVPGARPLIYALDVDEELLIARDTLECAGAGSH